MNQYIKDKNIIHLKNHLITGKCTLSTITAIKYFQSNYLGMIKPDGRIDINGKTISALEEFQRAILQVTGDGSATDPRKLKTRDAIIQVYGGISTTNEWVNASKYLSLYTIDSSIINNPSYNCINVYHPNKSKLDKFWCHKAMHPFLSKAFENLKTNNLLSELKEFGGYHNVRATRGTNYWSAHSWALAIDINITENPLNAEPKLSKKFVECFKNAGFGWGGDYKRKDGMHFTIAGFDIPKT